ncbi:14749_t:CDS:2 [Acaulospora colombiana]|uniref:14749_t:CDS:1 n=1 Tax=Acaulospora colombiana TaxID=27376 RepID=A0ACA9NRJ7_9GLOM|nr:14749_t:CDS:2 [Acaulospora colombiana]
MSTTATRVPPADPPFMKVEAEEEEKVSFVERILRSLIDTAMHYLPQLAIIVICIPVLALISLVAGIIVRNSVPQPWERRVFLQYGESPIPTAYFQFPPLVHDQAYDISVHLTVPYTESNIALGNFMTYLTVTTASNKTIASANRPAAILPQPKRGVIRRLLPIASAPSYTDMTITILPDWTPGTSQALYGHLEVGRRDGWKSLGLGEGREITVVESYVRGRVLLSGTRRVCSRNSGASDGSKDTSREAKQILSVKYSHAVPTPRTIANLFRFIVFSRPPDHPDSGLSALTAA